MPAAVGADNLNPRHAECAVLVAGHGAGDAVEVRRPAASGLELVIGFVQWCLTSCTGVDALLRVVLIKLSRAWCLGALLPENSKLLYTS